jgi:hypothetical protein
MGWCRGWGQHHSCSPPVISGLLRAASKPVLGYVAAKRRQFVSGRNRPQTSNLVPHTVRVLAHIAGCVISVTEQTHSLIVEPATEFLRARLRSVEAPRKP